MRDRLRRRSRGLRPRRRALDGPRRAGRPHHLEDILTTADPRVLRILDANLNRAREGIRVAEEVARFYLADAALAARLKTLRETIGGWDARLGLSALPVGRDSEADPGRPVMGVRETEREGIPGLVRANLRRAEEAARVIEEVAKLSDPSGVSEYKEMRYTLYSVEAELLGALARRGGA